MKNKDGFNLDDLGNQCWILNGAFHRLDGPAFISKNGKTKKWLVNGKLHREDGPAIESLGRESRWYLEDVPYSEEEYNAIQLSKKLIKELDNSNSKVRKCKI